MDGSPDTSSGCELRSPGSFPKEIPSKQMGRLSAAHKPLTILPFCFFFFFPLFFIFWRFELPLPAQGCLSPTEKAGIVATQEGCTLPGQGKQTDASY